MKIKESVLDNSKYPMGATVGIPFAPDRLPSASDAETVKTWALCQAPGEDGQPVSATYVLDKSDNTKLFQKSSGRLKKDEVLYIEGPTDPTIGHGQRFMVTSDGSAYLIGGKLWRLDDRRQDAGQSSVRCSVTESSRRRSARTSSGR